jgi:hypothetical protein
VEAVAAEVMVEGKAGLVQVLVRMGEAMVVMIEDKTLLTQD